MLWYLRKQQKQQKGISGAPDAPKRSARAPEMEPEASTTDALAIPQKDFRGLWSNEMYPKRLILV